MEILVINKNGKTTFNKEISMSGLFGNDWDEQLEKKAIQLMHNKKFQRQVVVGLAIGMFMAANPGSSLAFAAGPGGINTLGMKFWSYVKVFARWGCLIMCGIDVIKNLNAGTAKDISKVLFKYILAYAVVVLLPWVFDEIDVAVK